MRSTPLQSSLIIGLTLAGLAAARADYYPVPLTPGSFSQDIVIEKGAPPPLASYTTVTIDHGTNDYGNTFFESGYIASRPMMGLPVHGSTFTSRSDVNHVFQMPPDYTTNNCAFIGSDTIPGTSTLQVQVPHATLTVNNPTTSYQQLSILYGGGGNATNLSVTVHYADTSTDVLTINTLDWFNGNTAYAWIARGRVQVDGSAPLNNVLSTSATKLFNADLFLTDISSPVTSVDFDWVTNSAGTGPSSYRLMVFAVSGSTDGITFTPIPVSGFNADAVIEAGLPASWVPGCDVTIDDGPSGRNNTFYEQGFATNHYADQGFNGAGGPGGTWNGNYTGLPHPGATITSGTHNFVMPSSYVGNCCIFYGNYAAGAVSNGDYSTPAFNVVNVALTSPETLYGLSFLGSAGNGPAVANVTLDYSDGTTQAGSISLLDWFATTATPDFTCGGRVATFNGTDANAHQPALNNVGSTAVRLWHQDVTVSSQSAQVTNITLQWSSGGRAAIFGISAQTNSGGSFYPIPFSGFNADCIVEAAQPLFPAGIFSATTATMDLGTRNGNYTWFEQGWVTNGVFASLGMPPSGSTINSLVDGTHHYQLGTYNANNAILIDTNHQTALITPLTPSKYSAFAVLTAGASIGAGNTMTNAAILFHDDGTAETNNFFAYDWFDTTKPAAYITHARGDTRFGTGASLSVSGNQTPRLFETVFPVTGINSAVTNILLQYKLAGGVSWTTYALAVSATTNAVQPVLGPIVQLSGNPTVNVEGTNVVFLCTSETGSTPFTNQWQFSTDGGLTWGNLTDGGAVSGTGTLGFTNSSVGWTNAGQYRLVATNGGGFAISASVNLSPIYSALADVTQPQDQIVAYQPNGGSSPAAEGVANAIDNLIGTNRDAKYLNFGANGGTPFVGPIGLIVWPSIGKTTLSALRVYTANDNQVRDPIDFGLEGSNDGGNTWTPIAGGPLNLPATRNGPGWGPSVPPNVYTQALQEVHFPNTTGYFAYRLSFTNANNNASANSIQVGEVELLGVLATNSAVITRDLAPDVRVFAGASPTFSIEAYGYPPPLSYQWYSNNVAILGANSASYTLNDAQAGASGSQFYCVVSNSIPPAATSATATLTVIPAPSGAFATDIINDGPVAWYRLNEGPDDGTGGGNNGVITYDSWGGHNGFYTNTILQQPPYSTLDPDPYSAYFGKSGGGYIPNSGYPDSCVESINGLSFAATNTSAEMSVEAWVMLDQFQPVGGAIPGAGIVTKGYGGGGEQFAIDVGGGTAPNNTFRFYVRDTSGTAHDATSTVPPDPAVWHHLVGVLDEANSNVLLYVDGLLNGSATISPTNGLRDTDNPVTIGARSANYGTNHNLLFYGNVDEVVIYNHALSSNQVMNHFLTAGIAPRFTTQPTNNTINENASVCFYAPNYGSPTISMQWYQSADNGASFQPMADQTSSTLCLANIPASSSGYQYYLQATNSYGMTNSATAVLTVVGGAPNMVSCPNSSLLVYAGRSFSLASTFSGTLPISYQWYLNGNPVSNNGRISGATSNVLTIVNAQTNDIGNYMLQATNIYGGPATCGPTAIYVETAPDFNTELPALGTAWSFQSNTNSSYLGFGGTSSGSGHEVTLTDGSGSEAATVWYQAPLYVGGFQARFGYQATNLTGGGADGIAFVLQNDSRGPTALGGGGGGLGYLGVTPSVAMTLNIYPNASGGVGYSWGINGGNGVPYSSAAPVVINNGNLINIGVSYNGTTLSLAMTDTVSQATFYASTNVNIPALLGTNTAWVGFTGGDGGSAATQAIWDASYIPIPALSATPQGGNILLSWPGSVGGYALLQRANFASGSWSAVPATVNLVGNQYQAVVSAGGSSAFYRLVLQPTEP